MVRVGIIDHGARLSTEALTELVGVRVDWHAKPSDLDRKLSTRATDAVLLPIESTVDAQVVADAIEQLRERRPRVPILLGIVSGGRIVALAEASSFRPLHDRTARTLGLTPRQSEVLAEIRAGRTNREIAEALGMSLSTVNRHVENILQKLNARNRTEAALRGFGWPMRRRARAPTRSWLGDPAHAG